MPLSIHQNELPAGDSLMYDPAFRQVLEVHLPVLRTTRYIEERTIEPTLIDRYQGDFYGLLASLQIPLDQHWLIMRLNGFKSPREFGLELLNPYKKITGYSLIIHSDEYLRDLRSMFLTTRR